MRLITKQDLGRFQQVGHSLSEFKVNDNLALFIIFVVTFNYWIEVKMYFKSLYYCWFCKWSLVWHPPNRCGNKEIIFLLFFTWKCFALVPCIPLKAGGCSTLNFVGSYYRFNLTAYTNCRPIFDLAVIYLCFLNAHPVALQYVYLTFMSSDGALQEESGLIMRIDKPYLSYFGIYQALFYFPPGADSHCSGSRFSWEQLGHHGVSEVAQNEWIFGTPAIESIFCSQRRL